MVASKLAWSSVILAGCFAVLRVESRASRTWCPKTPLNFELGRESVFFLGLFGSGAAGAAPDVLLEAGDASKNPSATASEVQAPG